MERPLSKFVFQQFGFGFEFLETRMVLFLLNLSSSPFHFVCRRCFQARAICGSLRLCVLSALLKFTIILLISIKLAKAEIFSFTFLQNFGKMSTQVEEKYC